MFCLNFEFFFWFHLGRNQKFRWRESRIKQIRKWIVVDFWPFWNWSDHFCCCWWWWWSKAEYHHHCHIREDLCVFTALIINNILVKIVKDNNNKKKSSSTSKMYYCWNKQNKTETCFHTWIFVLFFSSSSSSSTFGVIFASYLFNFPVSQKQILFSFFSSLSHCEWTTMMTMMIMIMVVEIHNGNDGELKFEKECFIFFILHCLFVFCFALWNERNK